MDIFCLLTIWVYALFGLYLVNAVVSATAKAIYQVYGVTPNDLLVWGIQNPLWLYSILDRVAPVKTQASVNYFGGISND
jgi:hypothetical protein